MRGEGHSSIVFVLCCGEKEANVIARKNICYLRMSGVTVIVRYYCGKDAVHFA